jgi:hypothetical protein
MKSSMRTNVDARRIAADRHHLIGVMKGVQRAAIFGLDMASKRQRRLAEFIEPFRVA